MMNEIIQNMKERRSIRKFKDDIVPKSDIEQIIETGLYAPSGRNRQGVIIVVVTDKKTRDEFSAIN